MKIGHWYSGVGCQGPGVSSKKARAGLKHRVKLNGMTNED